MQSQPVREEWVPREGIKVDLGPAKGDEERVGHLDIVRSRTPTGPQQRSFWKPSVQELAILANGGYVLLTVASGSHPPVRIGAWDPDLRGEGTIDGFDCMCGGKEFRQFGTDDLMCAVCGEVYTTRPDPEYDLGVLAGEVEDSTPTSVAIEDLPPAGD